MDVDRMLSEMTPKQLVEWQAALEVVGVDQVQRQIAHLATVVLGCFWDEEKHGKSPTVDKVMGLIEVGKTEKREPIKWQTPEEIAGLLGKFVR